MKKKNKIVFVISDLGIGGAQKILLFLANFLDKKGFQVKILYFGKLAMPTLYARVFWYKV